MNGIDTFGGNCTWCGLKVRTKELAGYVTFAPREMYEMHHYQIVMVKNKWRLYNFRDTKAWASLLG